MYFLMVLDAGKSKIIVVVDLVSGESILPGLYMAGFSLSSDGHSKVPEHEERKITLFLFPIRLIVL